MKVNNINLVQTIMAKERVAHSTANMTDAKLFDWMQLNWQTVCLNVEARQIYDEPIRWHWYDDRGKPNHKGWTRVCGFRQAVLCLKLRMVGAI